MINIDYNNKLYNKLDSVSQPDFSIYLGIGHPISPERVIDKALMLVFIGLNNTHIG